MTAPLPESRKGGARTAPELMDTHAGLVFDKFFDRWSFEQHSQNGVLEKEAKQAWIAKFAASPVGQPDQLARSIARRAALVAARRGRTETFWNTARFVTGTGLPSPTEVGFAWHHCLGVPYLPGSTVKGMIRAWAEHWCESEGTDRLTTIKRLFGTNESQGAIIVFDALPCEPVRLTGEILTPHGRWRLEGPGNDAQSVAERAPGDWQRPVPVPYLAVENGQAYQFALVPTTQCQDGDLEEADIYLVEALEWIGTGAKTAIGMGRFETLAAAEARNRQAQEEKHRRRAEELEAKRNWTPSPGDRVYAAGEEAEVLGVDGSDVLVDFGDGSEPETVPLSEVTQR